MDVDMLPAVYHDPDDLRLPPRRAGEAFKAAEGPHSFKIILEPS